jgi:hypothetical protein
VAKSVTERFQIRCSSPPARLSLDKNWWQRQRSSLEQIGIEQILLFSAQFEQLPGWQRMFEHFSGLGSRCKRKLESLKIARLGQPRRVLLRSSGHHLDTQISQMSFGSARRILDRDRSPHKPGLLLPRESIAARCQKMCQLPFWIPQDSESHPL